MHKTMPDMRRRATMTMGMAMANFVVVDMPALTVFCVSANCWSKLEVCWLLVILTGIKRKGTYGSR